MGILGAECFFLNFSFFSFTEVRFCRPIVSTWSPGFAARQPAGRAPIRQSATDIASINYVQSRNVEHSGRRRLRESR